MQKEILESLPKEYLDMLKEVLKTAGTDKIYCDFGKTLDGTVVGNCYVIANHDEYLSQETHLEELREKFIWYDLMVSDWYRSNEMDPSCIILCSNEKISERRDHASYIMKNYECVKFDIADI